MAMAQAEFRRRPGHPRSQGKVPKRITLRCDPELFNQMKVVAKEREETQRYFVEAAVKGLLKLKPNKKRPMFQDNDDVARTGMWIDQDLLAQMDERIEEEGSSQRALLEDAIRRRLRQLSA